MRGAGPTRGGTRASTTGSRSMSSSRGTSSACAWASADRASEAPVTVASDAPGISRPASASWPCRLTSARWPLRSSASSSRLPRPSTAGTSARSASTRSMRSTPRSGSAVRSRPTRQAARSRRAGGRGSSRRRTPRRGPSAPSRSRSAAATPSTATTSGLRRRAPAGAVPVNESASRRPSRSGSSHRSCSSVDKASGNDSATGPGPKTVPLVGGSVVIGRACSRCSAPSWSTAHSTSCGPPYVRAAWRARRARRRRIPAGGRSASDERTSRTRPRRSRTPVHPSTSPDTSWSGPPGTAATTMRSRRPVTGSAPKSTPPHVACSIGWTRMAMSASTRPARRARSAERITPSSATSSSASPSTSRIDSKTPAIDDASPSSPVDDERTTTGSEPWRETTRHAVTAASRSCCDHAVVSTTPGRAGSPALRARARFAAFAPTRSGRPAAGSSSVTTAGGATVSTEDTVALHA